MTIAVFRNYIMELNTGKLQAEWDGWITKSKQVFDSLLLRLKINDIGNYRVRWETHKNLSTIVNRKWNKNKTVKIILTQGPNQGVPATDHK